MSKDQIHIIALSRKGETARQRFQEHWGKDTFHYISCDVNQKIPECGDVDYIIYAAGNTHPLQYSQDSIGTIASNIIGTKNMLDYAVFHKTKRFCFVSSVEIYGENRGDVDRFQEDYLCYIDCNTLRAGYPESKRAGEDIVLKSAGAQLYSYTYALDAAMGILAVLLKGESKKAYNISDIESEATLRQIAEWLAENHDVRVVFDIPDQTEQAGYSTATKALLDTKEICALGWRPQTHMREGLQKTVAAIKLQR